MGNIIMQSLIWLGSGLCIGLLGLLARLCPPTWGQRGWLKLLLIGTLTTLCVGWLATWLCGSYLATDIALWTTVLAIVVIPRGIKLFRNVNPI